MTAPPLIDAGEAASIAPELASRPDADALVALASELVRDHLGRRLLVAEPATLVASGDGSTVHVLAEYPVSGLVVRVDGVARAAAYAGETGVVRLPGGFPPGADNLEFEGVFGYAELPRPIAWAVAWTARELAARVDEGASGDGEVAEIRVGALSVRYAPREDGDGSALPPVCVRMLSRYRDRRAR